MAGQLSAVPNTTARGAPGSIPLDNLFVPVKHHHLLLGPPRHLPVGHDKARLRYPPAPIREMPRRGGVKNRDASRSGMNEV
jgi:hypothetical protein